MRENLLKGFKMPQSIFFEHTGLSSDYGKFIAYPFEPGFGTTMGNTLRRILLSSIQGYAITSVRITTYDADGVPLVVSSEFDMIPNIVEDTVEVLNNLKQMRVKLTDNIVENTFLFEFQGPCVVTSELFTREGQLEILTKKTTIFTMMENARVDFEIQIDLGRGYVPSDANTCYTGVIGVIPIDAIFTPIPRVKYTIEPCRVGQRNDYDKLVLEIWTDGTIAPDNALAEAAKIAKDHFAIFTSFKENLLLNSKGVGEFDEIIRQVLSAPVNELEISARSSNCLRNANIHTIGELTKKTEDDIIKTRNFGKKSLDEIIQKLQEWDLSFGMTDYSYLKNSIIFLSKGKKLNES